MTGTQAAAVRRALELVGDGYIYGATGWVCSLSRRLQQAEQYPEYHEAIMKTGAKWDGVRCWDCAQLTKTCAKAAGITFPSGATNQWKQVAWKAHGMIDSLPRDEPAFLYHRSGSGMSHTGLYLGDGTFVHAKGHKWGVLHEEMSKYAWTDWGTVWGDVREVVPSVEVLYQATVTAQNGRPVNMRAAPSISSARLATVALGTVVDVLAENPGWTKVRNGNQTGYMASEYLVKVSTNSTGSTDSTQERLAELEKRISAIEQKIGV